MAVGDMVTELNGYIDHNPDLNTYRNRVIGELSAAHQEFCTSAQWLFLLKTAIMSTLAPVVGSSTATVAVTSGAYAVSLTGSSPSTIDTDWEGHIFFGPDGEEYEIARVVAGAGGGADQIILMTRYAGDTAVDQEDWAIRFLQYALPVDAQEAVSFFDIENRVPIEFISRGHDEQLLFNRLSAGVPVLAADAQQRTDRPPDYAPTVAAAVGGTLDASSKYAVCYTFTQAGRESGPSPIAEVTTTALNKTISVSGLENTRDLGDDTGIWKKVYYRNVTRKGRWLCANPARADQLAENTTTYSITTETTARREENELPPQGSRQYVRLDPPAGDVRRIEVRYKVRVRPFASDNDIPLVPSEFERLIVFRALRRMCASAGAAQLWQLWKAEHDELYRACSVVHLARANVHNVRQPFRLGGFTAADLRLTGTYRVTG